MNIIFDLDGTIIDSRHRLYALFQHLAPESYLSYEAYWNLKMNKVSNENILSTIVCFSPAKIEKFKSKWMELIEVEEFLCLDQPIPGIREMLKNLQNHARLHLCTARQKYEPVICQLNQFEMLGYFEKIMVTQQLNSKQMLINKNVDISKNDWMIGDTGKDIQAGHALGVKTCAVLTGFLSKKSLEGYGPNVIIDSAANICAHLLLSH